MMTARLTTQESPRSNISGIDAMASSACFSLYSATASGPSVSASGVPVFDPLLQP